MYILRPWRLSQLREMNFISSSLWCYKSGNPGRFFYLATDQGLGIHFEQTCYASRRWVPIEREDSDINHSIIPLKSVRFGIKDYPDCDVLVMGSPKGLPLSFCRLKGNCYYVYALLYRCQLFTIQETVTSYLYHYRNQYQKHSCHNQIILHRVRY